MNYLSVCSGIEAATVAWHHMNWKPVAYSEIEPFPSAVLAHHYPDVPNMGDMTKYKDWILNGTIDLLVGGTPCQSFSVAGLRKGLEDPRGNLALVYLGIADHFRPRWIVWENVPGVLSSSNGRDFGSFLGALAELGYGFAYRVLDAQYFGVAQRRRRVFVVGCLGDWRPAAAVLFERESLRRDTPPSREQRKGIAGFTPTSFAQYGEGVGTLKAHGGDLGGGSETLVTQPIFFEPRSPDGTPRVYPVEGASPTLNTMGGGQRQPCVTHPSHTFKIRQGCEGGGKGYLGQDEKAFTLSTHQDQHLFHSMAVRRLTPVECERLQGFNDNYTNIPWRNKDESPDGPRYKALGNSMAVPVMRWIGERINDVDLYI